jgi:hypothetical protein
MAYEHKAGSGSVFKNDRKETSNHPDYTGSMKGLDGKMYWVSMWIKDGKKGKFLSLAQTEMVEKENDDLPDFLK